MATYRLRRLLASAALRRRGGSYLSDEKRTMKKASTANVLTMRPRLPCTYFEYLSIWLCASSTLLTLASVLASILSMSSPYSATIAENRENICPMSASVDCIAVTSCSRCFRERGIHACCCA